MATLTDLEQGRRIRVEATASSVRVLEADPELGAGIPLAQWPLAVGAPLAPVFEFERGPWRFTPRPAPGACGVLV